MTDDDRRFQDIDLARLPAPEVVAQVDAETLLAEAKAELVARAPELEHVLDAEGQVLAKLLQVVAVLASRYRAQADAQAKGCLLAFAWGGTLDHLAALHGVERLVLAPATDTEPAVMEADAELRRRVQLSLEAYSVAGVEGAYLFHGLRADPRVRDLAVENPTPGEVRVSVLSHDGTGTALPPLVAAVQAHLDDPAIRPVGAWVVAQSAQVLSYAVDAVLEVEAGPDPGLVEAAARAAVEAFVGEQHRLGGAATRAGLFHALYRPGVRNVELRQPAADVLAARAQAPYCTGVLLRRQAEG